MYRPGVLPGVWEALLKKQCWQHSCVCYLKPASAPDAQLNGSTSLIDPFEACSEWNPSWKTSVWPWPLHCNSVPGCYQTSYSQGHLCGELQFKLSNPPRVLCHEVPCWTSSGQYERTLLKRTKYLKLFYSKEPNTQKIHKFVWSCQADKTWTWWIGHVALHG